MISVAKPSSKMVEVKEKAQAMEDVDVTEPVPSSELGLTAVESMRKVREATYFIRLFQNGGFRELVDEHKIRHGESL